MKTKTLLSIVLMLSLIFAVAVSRSFAQSDPIYITLPGVPGAVKAALYTPDSGPRPHVGILLIHRTANFLSHLGCRELSARGFLALCMNPRFDNNEALVRWETIALDVRAGVNFLRQQPGITNVVLFGHSGGGPTTTFYQAVAENGPSYCQGPNKLVQCGDDLAGLPPIEGIILVNAHPGNPVNAVRSINPAIVNEDRPDLLDPELDPFNPKNGYNPTGPSTYSEEFKARYFKAQADRMNRLIDRALDIVHQIEEGTYRYPDDDAFPVVGGGSLQGAARLMQLDPSIHHSTVNPQKLIKNDGTIVTQIVESVRLPQPELAETSKTFAAGTKFLTVRSFLSANATRATDSMDGIDHCSSNNSTVCAVQVISIPILVTASQAHFFIRDSEIYYELSASKDKDFVVIEGATVGLTPCVPCEEFPGQYSNTVENFFNYVRDWINARF